MLASLRTTSGFVLIVAGVIGLLLPIIPGIPLLMAGVALLGRDHPVVRSVIERFERWRNRKRNQDESPSS